MPYISNSTNLGAAVSKKSLYTSGMHYGGLGRWYLSRIIAYRQLPFCPPGNSEEVRLQWLPQLEYFGYKTLAELRFMSMCHMVV